MAGASQSASFANITSTSTNTSISLQHTNIDTDISMTDMEDDLEATIREQVDEWSSESNECFTINLLRTDGLPIAQFVPEFTYPIFGEEEKIFGYQDLDITLSLAAHNLRSHLSISYKKKFKAIESVEATDINAALADFLPESAFSSENPKVALGDEQASSFVPPGEKIHEYARDGKKYQIWVSTLADPRAKELLENMQILVPLLIEGGSTLQLEQDWTAQRWKLFLQYEVAKLSPDATTSPYSLVGYGTSYRVFTFPDRKEPSQSDLDMLTPAVQDIDDFLPPPDSEVPNAFAPTEMPGGMSSPLDLPSRERLSQFLILPPYQKSGHGQELYNHMYMHLTAPTNVREFTVEDPNEAFDDLRDVCDLVALRAHVPEFAALRINAEMTTQQLQSDPSIPTATIIPEAVREGVRKQTKIMPRQFDRLVEMHTLSLIPPANRSRNRITRKLKATNEHDKAYYLWRLYVKARLFVFNRDQLIQVEREERIEKLEMALDSVMEKYVELIEKVEKREAERAVGGGEQSVGGAKVPRKRKVVEEEEDEGEEMEMEIAGANGVNGHKKVRAQ